MAKQIYLIYKEETFLGLPKCWNQTTFIGMYDDLEGAYRDILGVLEFDDEHTAEDARKMLMEHARTHGFETNYIIQTRPLNKFVKI